MIKLLQARADQAVSAVVEGLSGRQPRHGTDDFHDAESIGQSWMRRARAGSMCDASRAGTSAAMKVEIINHACDCSRRSTWERSAGDVAR